MAKKISENGDVVNKEEEVQHVSREELKQAKREAKAAKQLAAEKAEKDKVAQNPDAKKAQKGKQSATNQKPKLGQRMVKGTKEMVSELKKVTWPKWKTVASSTLVVVVVVLFFLIVLTAMDFGLGKLLELLVQKAGA